MTLYHAGIITYIGKGVNNDDYLVNFYRISCHTVQLRCKSLSSGIIIIIIIIIISAGGCWSVGVQC